MKKAILFVAVGVAVAVGVRQLGCTMGKVDWQQRVESMPDNAPPKWMFRNISAIRDNTDRIRELLERAPAQSAPPVMATG